MTYELPPDALDRDLVFRFFWKFSVFECAMKREGFLMHQEGPAQADWTKFGEAVRNRFAEVRAEGFLEAILTLKRASPRQQVVNGGRLGWKEVAKRGGESEESYVLRLVKTARNNLFHGGKYPDGPIDEVAHDKAVLEAALKVLEGCYELHPGMARQATAAA